MSRVSAEFAALIRRLLQDNSLTFRAAGLRSSISGAYWKDMADGRVPSEDVIDRIAAAFQNLDVNELRLAAGYCARPDSRDSVTAIEFALRGQTDIPEEGKRQILDLVKELQDTHSKQVDQ